MIIRPSDFDNGGEVDCTAHYSNDGVNKGRLSIRKNGDLYEVYVYWFIQEKGEILKSGTLKECVKYTNGIMASKYISGYHDTVEE